MRIVAALVLSLLLAAAAWAATRQSDLCSDATYHQILFCPAVLSDASTANVAQTTADAVYTTTEPDGETFICVVAVGAELSTAEEVEACATGLQIGSDLVDVDGSRQVSMVGLPPGATRKYQIVNKSPEGHYSNVVTSAQFTTAGASPTNAIPSWVSCDQSWGFSESVSLDLNTCASDSDLDALTFSVISGTLPTGLALTGSPADTISGTTGTSSETSNLVLGVTDSNVEALSGSIQTVAEVSDIAFSAKTGSFAMCYDVTPAFNDLNLVVSLSQGLPGGYDDMAVIIRFNTSGVIDARNGGAYEAINTITYAADGTVYNVCLTDVDVPNKTFSATVGEDGGAATVLATDYAFRTTTNVSSLDTFSTFDSQALTSGTTVNNIEIQASVVEQAVTFTVFTVDGTPPSAPSAPSLSGSAGAETVTLTLPASGAGDHASYEVWRLDAACGTPNAQIATGVTSATYFDSSLTAETSYCYALKDVDTSGNVSALGSTLDVTTGAAGTLTNNGVDCGSVDTASPCGGTTATHTIRGTTFTWNFNCSGGLCQVGRFIDGTPWARHPSGGSVSITSVTGRGSANGVQKNPGHSGTDLNQQGLFLDSAASDIYSSALDISDNLPYLASPDNGVYVTAKSHTCATNERTSATNGKQCADAYSALTVVQNIPVANGSTAFRPGMSGDSKAMLTLSDFDFTKLPQKAAIQSLQPSSYSNMQDWFGPVLALFTGYNGDAGRRWPLSGFPDYAADRAERLNKDIYQAFTTDAFTGAKAQGVYAIVQHGIDVYQAYLHGVEWNGGAGQNQGRWAPMVFMATLSTDATVRTNVQGATNNMSVNNNGDNLAFIELYQVRANQAGNAIWGSYPGADGCSQGNYSGHGRYWSEYAKKALQGTGETKRTCGDPYGYIDGPGKPGDHYNVCCSTGVYVSIGLIMRFWPEFRTIANNDVMYDYAARVMDGAGYLTSDDQCASHDPREATSCAPYTTSSASSTGCIYFGNTWGYDLVNNDQSCVTKTEAQARGWNGGGTPTGRWQGLNLNGRPQNIDREQPGYQLWDSLKNG